MQINVLAMCYNDANKFKGGIFMVDLDDLNFEIYIKIKIVNVSENEDSKLKETFSKECKRIEFITVNPTLQHNDNEIDNMLRAADITFIVTKGDEEHFQLANKVAERAVSLGSLCVGLILDNESWDFENHFDVFFKTSKENILPIVKLIYVMLTEPGLIGLDYADVKTVLQDGGEAVFAFGEDVGENASVNAVKAAINNSPLKTIFKDSKRILLNFMGSSDNISMFEINEGFQVLLELAHPNANILFGANLDDSMGENISVTIIATGFGELNNEDSENNADNKISSPMSLDIDMSLDIEGWLRKDNKKNKEQEQDDDLVPHPNGKKVCETLSNMRKELAKANNIPFESKDCDFNGLCAGTCAKCDSEATYLRQKLLEISPEKIKYPRFDSKN